MAPGGVAYADVVKAFGPSVLAPDGSLDRKRLGDLVFADAEARARLNALVHPHVREEEQRRAAAVGGPGTPVVTDAALLVEAGVHLRFHRLVVVHCPPEIQLRRLQERDGLDRAAAEARLAAQMPIEDKRRFAHFEVDTSGGFVDSDRQADALAEKLRALARTVPAPAPVAADRAAACLVLGPAAGPRGLTPAKLLAEMVTAGGPEMERLARALVPPARGPWYRAADDARPGPETLAAPIVLWSLARAGPDDDHVVAAAASLARLVHADPAARADACLQALLLQSAAVAGNVDPGLRNRLYAYIDLAARWGGARPGARVREALRSARRHPQDPARASADAADPETGRLAAALVAIAAGSPAVAVPPDLLSSLPALNRLAAG